MVSQALETFEIGKKVYLEFSITKDELKAFAELSGDYNPIHQDANFAHSQGYSGPIVFGALLVAKLSQIIGLSLPGPKGVWSSLQIDFKSALLVNELAMLEVELTQISHGTNSLLLKFKITAANKVIANGRALTTLHNAKF